jgi:hypothetical protein
MVFFIVNLAHADAITALIVDQDEAFLALAAYIAENVVLAAQDVDVTLSFIKVVKVPAFFAEGAVLGRTFASNSTDLSLHLPAHEQQHQGKQPH